ncbi:hypothetical protein WDZ92_25035, partial [Nostoc sp. NIES-2111]
AAGAIVGVLSNVINFPLAQQIAGIGLLEQLSATVKSLAAAALMALAVFGIQCVIGDRVDPFGLLLKVGSSIVVGAAIYIGCSGLLWLAMGKPKGAETELARFGAMLLAARFPRRTNEAPSQ